MPNLEHEHKFLVVTPSVLDGLEGTSIVQGYFGARTGFSMRVRCYPTLAFTESSDPTTDESDPTTDTGVYTIAVKGPRAGVSRTEEEGVIPAALGELALAACESMIEKTRYSVVADVPGDGDRCWDVDVFHGDNAGLIIAELEKGRPGDMFEVPTWCGEEVTDDPRYYNDALSRNPFGRW